METIGRNSVFQNELIKNLTVNRLYSLSLKHQMVKDERYDDKRN